jgi:K+-sensing histidine kinase KdpD
MNDETHRFWPSASQCLLGSIVVALLTFVCYRLQLNLTTTSLLYLIFVVLVSLVGGSASSAFVSFIAVLYLAYFFAPPTLSLRVDKPLDVVALIAFLGTALIIISLISKHKRTEEVLHEQASLLNLTHETVFVRDINNVITY